MHFIRGIRLQNHEFWHILEIIWDFHLVLIWIEWHEACFPKYQISYFWLGCLATLCKSQLPSFTEEIKTILSSFVIQCVSNAKHPFFKNAADKKTKKKISLVLLRQLREMPSSIIKIKRQYKVGVEKAAHKDSIISAFFCTLPPKGRIKKESGRPVIKKSKEGRESEGKGKKSRLAFLPLRRHTKKANQGLFYKAYASQKRTKV